MNYASSLLLQRKACHPDEYDALQERASLQKMAFSQWHRPCQDLSKFAADRPDWNRLRSSSMALVSIARVVNVRLFSSVPALARAFWRALAMSPRSAPVPAGAGRPSVRLWRN